MKFDGLGAYTYTNDTLKIDIGKGRSITIRQAGGQNRDYGRIMAEKTKPHAKAIELDELDVNTRLRIAAETYAEAIITGWEGFTSDGKPVPFDRDNAVALLLAHEPLFNLLVKEANDERNFTGSGNEHAVKN